MLLIVLLHFNEDTEISGGVKVLIRLISLLLFEDGFIPGLGHELFVGLKRSPREQADGADGGAVVFQPLGPWIIVPKRLDNLKPEIIGKDTFHLHGCVSDGLAPVEGIRFFQIVVLSLGRRGAGSEQFSVRGTHQTRGSVLL